MFQRYDRTTTARRLCAWCVLAVFAFQLPGAPAAFAAPTGENVVHGEATFTRDGNETLIETGTDETIVDYDGFDIMADEIVRIDQPNADSRILNRVPFGDPSDIDGSLLSNGIVYILNPAGVFVGDTAIIDVNGLVAAAGDLSNEDFLAGSDLFALSGDVMIAEGAQIDATDSVALLGRRVANFGTIQAKGGYVAFVAGDQAVLGKLDGRLVIRVDGGDPEQEDFALTQAGEVEGPRVSLTAGDTYSLAMNHTGVTRGREIELRAGTQGLVQVAGELDASATAPGETGGRIHVLGDKIAVLAATLDASGAAGGGEIRVGGDVRGGGDLPTARRLYIAPGAVLRADAIERGDGGSIVTWAEEKTGFYGAASATGGSAAGDGGFIEISGRQSLEAKGHSVDLGAANGESGTLLYDPNAIVIIGGAASDGSDIGDAAELLEGGVLGRILEGDIGTGNPEDSFEIYESELEGTDADIELVATTKIETSGTFDDSNVVIMPGNDLTIRTAGEAEDEYQIDLAADGNENLRWVVSEGGTIFITTNSGETDGMGADGNIRIGELEFQGREFDDPTPDIFTPIATSRSPIGVTARQGDITILGDLVADGNDATFTPAAGEEGPRFQTAEPGGNVSIATLSGDIEVGSISSRGGSAIAESPAVGGSGGFVLISSEDGSVSVMDDIDVSGGDGIAGTIQSEGEDIFVSGLGGRGGAISLNAADVDSDSSVTTTVTVMGDLIAPGGNASGFIFEPDIGGLSFSSGGQGGQVAIEAGSVDVSDSGIDVSAGHGPVEGGNAVNGSDSPFLNLLREGGASLRAVAVSIVATDGDVDLSDVEIDASGGAAGTETNPEDPNSTIDAGPGGRGGSGGSVEIASVLGDVSAGTLRIEADAGAGSSAGSGPAAPIGAGGGARNVTILASKEVTLGDISARGGSGEEGPGGAGGLVTISSGDDSTSGDISITIADIDTSGGDARSSTGRDLDGGGGGSITVSALDEAAESSSITLTGGLGGLGGTATGEGVAGEGASVVLTSPNGAILIDPGSPDAGVASPFAELTADTIGTSANPLRISGTPGEDDRATITAEGDAFVELVDGIFAGATEIRGALETLRLEQAAVGDDVNALFTQGVNTLIEVEGSVDGPTIRTMGTGDDDEPRLEYGLFVPEDQIEDVTIDRGAVDLGERGGSVSSAGAIVGAAGVGTHVETDGDFTLDGETLGADGAPLELQGDANAALRLVAGGNVDATIMNESFGAYAVVQRDVAGTTNVGGMDTIDIAPEADLDPEAPVSEIKSVTTTASFAYELDTDAGDSIRIIDLRAGDASILAPGGDITLAPAGGNAAVTLAGDRLTLVSDPPASGGSIIAGALNGAGAHIDLTGGDGELLLLAGGAAGTSAVDGAIVTQGLAKLAARHGSGLHLTNNDGGRLEISELENFDAGTLGDDRSGDLFAGVLGAGDTVIRNDAGGSESTIVLGDVAGFSASQGSLHIASGGDLELLAEKIEISNARFYVTTDADGNDVVEATNNARLTAAGDIVLGGTVDTSADSTAMDEREDPETPILDEFVQGELILESTAGVTRFEGDVGMTRSLARLDTTDAVLPDGARNFDAEEVIFRGSLDGPGSASVRYESGTATHVAFGGDVGTGGALAGLDVQAEQIDFAVANSNGSSSSANQVNVAGNITLRADPSATEPPRVATITDTQGGLSMQASGDITVGDLDKVSVTGRLRLTSSAPDGRVRVGDLSADSIRINAPTIEIVRRPGGMVELADGSVVSDAGTDFVANEIVLSSSPMLVETGAAPTFYLGSGGVSLPGELNGITLRRLNGRLSAVGPDLFAGQNGRVLDLTGSGPDLVADPTSHIPRPEPLVLPGGPPEVGADAPVAAPLLGAPAVLAFLRCGGPELRSACASGDEAALQSLTAYDRAGLATARALEVTERYRELVAAPAAGERLRARFAEAGRAYAAATGWSEGEAIDGAVFYAFLARAQLPALEAVRELSWILTQVQLLGMSEGDTRRLQSGLADEFAIAAALPGFTGASALAAVEASPIGLPPAQAALRR
jgi:filamentous hemagglutinin family protein